MSDSAQSLSRKIAGATDLQGVVRSMKALAASSIAQYEKAVGSLDDYYRTLELALSACFHAVGPPADLVKPLRRGDGIGAVIFGSDQGLVGGFNETIVDFATKTLAPMPGKLKRLWPVGDRTRALLIDTGLISEDRLPVPSSVNAITSLVGQLLIEVGAATDAGEVAEVYVFHNHPKTGSLYEPVCKRLLPLDDAWRKKLAERPWPTKSLPEVIEGVPSAVHAFVRGYLFVLLFQACAESLASENASRLAAMQRADKNIDSMLDDLTRTLHRVRQESIDEELFDVISGFEALNKQKRPRDAPT
ncbi:MAG: F0F1 ATP synthase subunit gamma [Acidobacteriaceae bacterium]